MIGLCLSFRRFSRYRTSLDVAMAFAGIVAFISYFIYINLDEFIKSRIHQVYRKGRRNSDDIG